MKNTHLPEFNTIDSKQITTHLESLLKQNLETQKKILAANRSYTWENLMLPLEEMEDQFHRFWSPIAHLHAVADNPDLRSAYNAAIPLLTDYHIKVAQNEKLFAAIQNLAENHFNQLDPAQQMIINHNLRDFKLAGVGEYYRRKKKQNLLN